MAYFPMFVNIENKKVYVIGGGKVAKRKVKVLKDFGADVTIVAKETRFKFDCNVIIDEYRHDHIKDAFMVVAATDDREVNKNISEYCKNKGIYVNVADSKDESTFIFGAVMIDDDNVIGVSTSGKDPSLAKEIRDNIGRAYDRDKNRNQKKQAGA